MYPPSTDAARKYTTADVTSSSRVSKRSSIAAIGQVSKYARIPNGTTETRVQNAEDIVPISNAIRDGVTRYAAIGPSVNGNAIGISRESKRESAMATAQRSVTIKSVAVENCMKREHASVGERRASPGGESKVFHFKFGRKPRSVCTPWLWRIPCFEMSQNLLNQTFVWSHDVIEVWIKSKLELFAVGWHPTVRFDETNE